MTFIPVVLVALLGLAIGSFLNVCIYRVPRDESIAFPGSHCTVCNEDIKRRDLIPVISYFLLRGKCRNCGTHISIKYPIVEVLTSMVFVHIFLKFEPMNEYVYSMFMMVFFAMLIVIAFIDGEHMIIPDKIVIPGIVLGVVANTVGRIFIESSNFISWHESLIGALVGSVPLFIIGLIGTKIAKQDALGFGDVKFIAMIGAFLGWQMVIITLFLAVVIGAIIGIIIKVRLRFIISDDNEENEENNHGKMIEMPFGPMLALGGAIAALYGWDILYWYLRLVF